MSEDKLLDRLDEIHRQIRSLFEERRSIEAALGLIQFAGGDGLAVFVSSIRSSAKRHWFEMILSTIAAQSKMGGIKQQSVFSLANEEGGGGLNESTYRVYLKNLRDEECIATKDSKLFLTAKGKALLKTLRTQKYLRGRMK